MRENLFALSYLVFTARGPPQWEKPEVLHIWIIKLSVTVIERPGECS